MARAIITDWRLDDLGLWVSCPECKNRSRLDHSVAANGDITPSLDCPNCNFHTMARLGDWTHGDVEARGIPQSKGKKLT